MCCGEPFDKRSLSDARLAAHQHKTAIARGYVAEDGLQFTEEFLALV